MALPDDGNAESRYGRLVRKRLTMRQLLGKVPSKERGALDEVYLSEHVRCRECQKTAPMGIEVVTVKKDGRTKKVLKRAFFCRIHGADYYARAQGER